MAIVEHKVKPERISLPPKNSWNKQVASLWWLFGAERRELKEVTSTLDRVIFHAYVSKCLAFAFLDSALQVAGPHYVITLRHYSELGLLQCSIHESWAIFFSASLEERLRYTPSDCFETFPFPAALLDSAVNDPAGDATRQSLEAIGERYHQFRSELMVSNNEGLTSTYNRFHDPAETSSGLLQLRTLHDEMDQAVLAAYGWSDVLTQAITANPHHTPCGFGLDYLDLEDEAQLPEALQERIDSGDLFFWDAREALNFQGQLQAHGAITGRRKLPWRYRWPDNVRDDVLARLLALNAERYAEEVAQGLHGKGGKKAATAAGTGGGGKRRGRPAKASQPRETEGQQTEQMGLGL